MGFQFNHVGGGTKTRRRPITLHMKYNSALRAAQLLPHHWRTYGEQEVTPRGAAGEDGASGAGQAICSEPRLQSPGTTGSADQVHRAQTHLSNLRKCGLNM